MYVYVYLSLSIYIYIHIYPWPSPDPKSMTLIRKDKIWFDMTIIESNWVRSLKELIDPSPFVASNIEDKGFLALRGRRSKMGGSSKGGSSSNIGYFSKMRVDFSKIGGPKQHPPRFRTLSERFQAPSLMGSVQDCASVYVSMCM